MSMENLGRAIEQDGVFRWERGGRSLTKWELRMRSTMGDAWVPAFGNVYRLALDMPSIWDIERPYALGQIYGALRAGDDLCRAQAGLSDTMTRLVRHALRCGGVAVINGERCTVSASDVEALMQRLATMPEAETWRLALPVVEALMIGRPATPEEQAAFCIPDNGPPIAPAWALSATA